MANEEQLAILRQGVDVWNAWREKPKNEIVVIDLSYANLSRANLSRANLDGANLIGTNLGGTNLSDANLSDANLRGSYLWNANLIGANLTGANLIYATLSCVDLSGKDLSGKDLSGTFLDGANLTGANLSDANLTGSYFWDADLTGADLRDAILSGAILSGTNFSDADLSRVDLSGKDLRGAIFTGANLTGKDLSRTNLTGANLTGQDLTGANLTGANLTGANLTGANLTGKDLSGKDLSGANFTGACLRQIQALETDFTNAILTGTCIEDWHINSATKLDGVICEYVFLKLDSANHYQERRPSDPDRTFAAGEFIALIEQYLDTVDLIFTDGINWQAFFSSFQELQQHYQGENLSIQSFEKKPSGAFVIRLEAPPGIDKGELERNALEKYQEQLRCLESYYQERLQLQGEQLTFYKEQATKEREENTQLIGIVKTMAEKPGNTYNTYQNGAKFGGGSAIGDGVTTIGGTLNDFSNAQDLTEAAAKIQTLLTQLQKQGVTPEVAQQQVADDLADQAKKDDAMLGNLVKWGQKLGDATVTDVVKGVVKLALRSAGVPIP